MFPQISINFPLALHRSKQSFYLLLKNIYIYDVTSIKKFNITKRDNDQNVLIAININKTLIIKVNQIK